MHKIISLCALSLFLCSSLTLAGYKIHSDSDLTIDTPLYITSEGLIGSPRLMSHIKVDPSLPVDTLVITSGGTIKIDLIAIESTGDILIKAENMLDIFGILESKKNIRLETVKGDMDLDGKFRAGADFKASSGNNANVGLRLAEKNRLGIRVVVTKVDLDAIASGRYVKFVPSELSHGGDPILVVR